MKQLIKEYERGEVELSGCKYPSTINLQEALDVTSSLWATLDDSSLFVGVPYCIKRQIIDLKHMIKRCTEEEAFAKDEMTRTVMFYERKLGELDGWSKQIANIESGSLDSRTRGLSALVLSKRDEIAAFTLHLQDLYARNIRDDKEERDEGILSELVGEGDGYDTCNNSDDENPSDAIGDVGYDDIQDTGASDLEEQDVLEDLLSLLNAEYGSDDASDTDVSDCDSDDS